MEISADAAHSWLCHPDQDPTRCVKIPGRLHPQLSRRDFARHPAGRASRDGNRKVRSAPLRSKTMQKGARASRRDRAPFGWRLAGVLEDLHELGLGLIGASCCHPTSTE